MLKLEGEAEEDDEGCLSLPGLQFPTPRAPRAIATGFNMYGDPVTIEGTELLARCVQHETDHLDGILFIDRLDKKQRKLAMKAIREAEWSGLARSPRSRSPRTPPSESPKGACQVRLVFAGTPEVALPALRALADLPAHGGGGRHAAGRARRARPAAGGLAGGRARGRARASRR